MRRSPTDSGFDTSRFTDLPDCTTAEAAWLAGVAEEAMVRYLEEANGALIEGRITLANLLRAAFGLLGRKENQAALLRLQLSTTLEREKELSETLRAGLLGTGVVTVAIEAPKAVKPGKKKKK
ncbi:MAG: hypothetical protein HQM03_03230 [Magnetococcales bacterium]|nr:hypothetical protein [Magnetococcales bacterium]